MGKWDGQYRVKLSFSEMAAEAYRCGKRIELLPDADATEWLRISPVDQCIQVNIA
jgi:hypothetical protein